jgi:hypothetical protein
MGSLNIQEIINSLVIGGLFGYVFIKISQVKNNFNLFEKTVFKFVQQDVNELQRTKYDKISREELLGYVNQLEKRILVIETKIEEREKT